MWDAEAAAANAGRVESSLTSLRADLRSGAFKDFWSRARETNQQFKDLKPIDREVRARLWSDFNALCVQAKADQERANSRRAEVSRGKREVVMRRLDDASWQAKSATSAQDIKRAQEILAEARSWMKPGWNQVSLGDSVLSLNDGRLAHDDHQACWQRSVEVNDTINWKWKELKAGWDAKADDAFRRISDRVEKARSVVRSIEGQIDNCFDMQRNAKSGDFADRVQGWIDEKRSKVRDIEDSISRDEEKLRDIARKRHR